MPEIESATTASGRPSPSRSAIATAAGTPPVSKERNGASNRGAAARAGEEASARNAASATIDVVSGSRKAAWPRITG